MCRGWSWLVAAAGDGWGVASPGSCSCHPTSSQVEALARRPPSGWTVALLRVTISSNRKGSPRLFSAMSHSVSPGWTVHTGSAEAEAVVGAGAAVDVAGVVCGWCAEAAAAMCGIGGSPPFVDAAAAGPWVSRTPASRALTSAAAAPCAAPTSGIRSMRRRSRAVRVPPPRRAATAAANSTSTENANTAQAMNPMSTRTPMNSCPVSWVVNASHACAAVGTDEGSRSRPSSHSAIGAATTRASRTTRASSRRISAMGQSPIR